jgi:hypothetical protein
MKKALLLEFIRKHTTVIDKCRWVSNSKDKTLKTNAVSPTKNLLCDITLSNWDGFGDAEIGIGSMDKMKRELGGIYGEDITTVLNKNDDGSRIISVDFLDGESVATLTTSDLDMIPPSSRLKSSPTYNAEIIFDGEFIGRFLKAKAALPDVKNFTVMMNKKGVLELVVGYSNINSSRFALKVKTTPGLDKVADKLHFQAEYLRDVLASNSECDSSVLKISDVGICSIEFVSGDFIAKYYLTSTDDLN